MSPEDPTAKKKPAAPAGPPVDVERRGNVILIPDGMPYDDAITWITRRKVEDSREVAVHHEFEKVYPLDALVAFQRALSEIFNWVDQVPTPGFWGDTPPTMITVRTGPYEFMQIAWGSVAIPGVQGRLGMTLNPQTQNFIVNGKVQQGSMEKVQQILAKAEELTRTKSIYRGQAIKVNWNWTRDAMLGGFNLFRDCPHFMDFAGASEHDLVFSQDVSDSLTQGLFTPIEYSDALRANQVPLKRGILLEGPYGTGKTLTAMVAAIKAVRHKWTFIYLESVLDLPKGLLLAQQYAPSIIFAEDIDRVLEGDRTMYTDLITNCLDGVDTKQLELITVLTTNHIEKINKVMLRPGRVDTVVNIRPPDAEAAKNLVVKYGRGLFERDVDLAKIGKILAGKIPAVIREVVERSKIAAIGRIRSAEIRGRVSELDLTAAITALEAHSKLLIEEEKKETRTAVLVPLDIVETLKREGEL